MLPFAQGCPLPGNKIGPFLHRLILSRYVPAFPENIQVKLA